MREDHLYRPIQLGDVHRKPPPHPPLMLQLQTAQRENGALRAALSRYEGLFAEALEELARLRARGVTGESSRSGGDEERTLLKALQTARARRRFTADGRRIDRMLWRLGCRLFSKK